AYSARRPEPIPDGFLGLAAPPSLYHCPQRGIFLTQAPHCRAPGLIAVGDWETSRRARGSFQPDLVFLDRVGCGGWPRGGRRGRGRLSDRAGWRLPLGDLVS